MQRAQARVALEQEARPDARSVRRAGEQSRHGGRRHLGRRRRAPAGPPPAPAADHPPVRPDLDLDKRGLLRTVGRVRAPATPAHPRTGRRVVLLGALLESRPLRAAVARRPGLLAPPPLRARPLPPFARAAGLPLRQYRPRRAKLRQPALEALDPPPQRPHFPAAPGLVPPQLSDRRLPAPRSAQRLAQRRVRLVAGPVKAPHLGPAGIERLPQRPALLRRRSTSIRSAITVLRFPVSTPASRSRPSRRPTSLCNAKAFRAARRASRVSAMTFFSFRLDASHRDFHDPASQRARTSAHRSSSARASAAVRPLTLTLVQRPPVRTLRRLGTGHRPQLSRPLGQRHARLSVRVPYRHATDDNTFRIALPAPPQVP